MIANIKWGVLWGIRMATGFSVFVIAEYLLLGPAPFIRIGSPLHVVIAFYVVSGITAGALIGALKPFTQTRPGSIAVGILGALVVGTIIFWTKSGPPNHWTDADWGPLVFGSILYGVFFSSDRT
jgi:hypothetical protein